MTEPGKLQGTRRTRIDPKPLRAYAADWNVLVCTGGPDCRKRWGKTTHLRGRVDSFGMIHWSHIDAPASARSLYRLLTFVALALSQSMRREPEWRRLYEQATWASRTMMSKYKRRVHVSWNEGERERCGILASQAGVAMRARYVKEYMWVYNGRKRRQRRRLVQRSRDSQGGRGDR